MTTAEKILRAKQDYDDVYSAGYEKGKAEGGGSGGSAETIVLATAFTTAAQAVIIFNALLSNEEKLAIFTLESCTAEEMPIYQCTSFLCVKDNDKLSGYIRNYSVSASTGYSQAHISSVYSLVGSVGDVYIKEGFE